MKALSDFSLLIVDDHPLFRDGLVLALQNAVPGLRAQAVGTIAEAWNRLTAAPLQYDLVLVDHNLTNESGLLAALSLRKAFPGVAVGLMSGVDGMGLSEKARAGGLVVFVPKSLELPALLDVLARIAEGDSWFPPALARQRVMDLTARQLEILELAAGGASNKEISRHLGISPSTVKNHLAQIYERLGAGNRVQAVTLTQHRAPDHDE
ncbi:MAG: response regulator transcription factor [Pseudomonadota bacterium]